MENLQGGTLALEHRYHLDRRISTESLISRYAATQEPFGLPVQVVIFEGLPEAGAEDALIERIRNSAERASHQRIEGVLSVVDFGELERGVPFVIEQSAAGTSLAAVLERRGTLPPGEVVLLVERLAAILERAHHRELFHGALTARWVRLPEGPDAFERATLSFFSVGLTLAELRALPHAALTTDLVDAFAPEVFAEDEAINPVAADQWALGALAYRALCGVHPYFDDPIDASEGLVRIASDPAPTLEELGVEEAISSVIDRALQRDPSSRWPTLSDFAHELRLAVHGPEPDSAPTPAPSSPPEVARREDAELPDTKRESPPSLPEPPRSSAPLSPRPSGYLLTLALALFILSNLGWFFFAMGSPSGNASTEPEAPTAQVLTSGLQIHSEPPGARLYTRSPESGEESLLGATPQALTDFVFEGQQGVDFVLRLEGYQDQALRVEESLAGQDLRITLQPDDR
ncbi:hypothetical protein DV096_06900 [Bradymonadaceae bacterium TMQ3]|uniref:Protein kinase domain-containing protein n=1 Tax=Lujinxingia sediminis TaxID=2480984 RepID=A0ABY0CTY8_9DELT|nr:hypothetical protein [Lujinxingia sediminis]RDV38536.1 hypothetical protein DV096_06900 [Bradymonadaceae bacterium TMQ3]RVU44917.1 hypothetical protein EA187_10290 [Lujinxingia sediminis]TXC76696.1 hypothetical protein FRC91_08165 [Bradymonadales bacterium TMQ1]